MSRIDRGFRFGGGEEVPLSQASTNLSRTQQRRRVLAFVDDGLAGNATVRLDDAQPFDDWLVSNASETRTITIVGPTGAGYELEPGGSSLVVYRGDGGMVEGVSKELDLAAPGPIGGTTPAPGTFTTLAASSLNLSGLTASRYVITDGSKNLSSQQGVPLADLGNAGGSAGDLARFNGSNWVRFAAPGDGKYTVQWTGGAPSWVTAFDAASPGAIGGTAPAAGTFTALTASSVTTGYVSFGGATSIGEYSGDPNGFAWGSVGSLLVDPSGPTIWQNIDGAQGWDFFVKYGDLPSYRFDSGVFASRLDPAYGLDGSRYTATDSPVAEWVKVSGVWRPIVDGVVGVEVPTTGWSWVNQGAAAVDESKGAIHLSTPSSASLNQRMRVRVVPGTPYTITACVVLGTGFSTTASNFALAALVFRASGAGTHITFGFTWNYNAGGSTYSLTSSKYNSATSFNSNYFDYKVSVQHKIWLRLQDTGANRVCSWSPDGRNFHTVHTIGRTDFLTADQVGICVEGSNNTAAITLLSWEQ